MDVHLTFAFLLFCCVSGAKFGHDEVFIECRSERCRATNCREDWMVFSVEPYTHSPMACLPPTITNRTLLERIIEIGMNCSTISQGSKTKLASTTQPSTTVTTTKIEVLGGYSIHHTNLLAICWFLLGSIATIIASKLGGVLKVVVKSVFVCVRKIASKRRSTVNNQLVNYNVLSGVELNADETTSLITNAQTDVTFLHEQANEISSNSFDKSNTVAEEKSNLSVEEELKDVQVSPTTTIQAKPTTSNLNGEDVVDQTLTSSPVNLLVVGPKKCGKTYFTLNLGTEQLTEEIVNSNPAKTDFQFKCRGMQFSICVKDTSSDMIEREKVLKSMVGPDGIIILFDHQDQESYRMSTTYWMKQCAERKTGSTKLFLIGLNCKSEKRIPINLCLTVAREHGAMYFEIDRSTWSEMNYVRRGLVSGIFNFQ